MTLLISSPTRFLILPCGPLSNIVRMAHEEEQGERFFGDGLSARIHGMAWDAARVSAYHAQSGPRRSALRRTSA